MVEATSAFIPCPSAMRMRSPHWLQRVGVLRVACIRQHQALERTRAAQRDGLPDHPADRESAKNGFLYL